MAHSITAPVLSKSDAMYRDNLAAAEYVDVLAARDANARCYARETLAGDPNGIAAGLLMWFSLADAELARR